MVIFGMDEIIICIKQTLCVNDFKAIVEPDSCMGWLYGMFDEKLMMGAVDNMR